MAYDASDEGCDEGAQTPRDRGALILDAWLTGATDLTGGYIEIESLVYWILAMAVFITACPIAGLLRLHPKSATLDTLLAHKLSFLDTLANVGMSWWVSGIVFCATILAGCWWKQQLVTRIPYFNLFCSTVTVFYLSVVGFGVLMALQIGQLEADVDVLLQAMHHSDQTRRTDFRIVQHGYLIGSTSFSLITLCWLALWRILFKQRRQAAQKGGRRTVSARAHAATGAMAPDETRKDAT